MLNEGTTGRKAADVSQRLNSSGAHSNLDQRRFHDDIAFCFEEGCRKGFDLFSDVVLHPSFPAEELLRKKELVKGALKQREEEPSFVAGREFIKNVFDAHPYGGSSREVSRA